MSKDLDSLDSLAGAEAVQGEAVEVAQPDTANLDALLDEQPKGGDAPTAPAPDAEAAKRAAAEAGAAFAIGFLETIIKAQAPYVVIPDEQKAAVVDKTAAVLAKHGGEMPAWMVPWKEEIELGLTLGACGFSIWMQVQAKKALEAELQAKLKDSQQGQQSQGVDLSKAA